MFPPSIDSQNFHLAERWSNDSPQLFVAKRTSIMIPFIHLVARVDFHGDVKDIFGTTGPSRPDVPIGEITSAVAELRAWRTPLSRIRYVPAEINVSLFIFLHGLGAHPTDNV